MHIINHVEPNFFFSKHKIIILLYRVPKEVDRLEQQFTKISLEMPITNDRSERQGTELFQLFLTNDIMLGNDWERSSVHKGVLYIRVPVVPNICSFVQ